MTDAALPQVGTLLDGRYELVSQLGKGGCAVVFEAIDLRLERQVAVKFPWTSDGSPAKIGRFGRESRVIASIQHPNVCAAVDSGESFDGRPYLVMERLYGESLRVTLQRVGRLRVGDALSIGLQLASAIGAVHEAGIVHRDVKPDNIVLVTRGGCEPLVKLLDFGLCREVSVRDDNDETRTIEGAIVGTPEYMAPEQILGSGRIDGRVDMYALGLVLYETLTGDRPFYSHNVREVLRAVMKKSLPPLCDLRPDAPRSLEYLLECATSRSASKRPASAEEFYEGLINARRDLELGVVRQPAPSYSWE